MRREQALNFSLADFYDNDNPDILKPPKDYQEWVSFDEVRFGMSFFSQPLLGPPKVRTRTRTNADLVERDVVNLTSYNYLGLATHPEVMQGAKEALEKYGMSSSGSPMISGVFDLHLELENRLSKFKNKEACMLFSSGYGGNLGSLQGILRPDDLAIMDEKIHRSILDGVTLAGAKKVFFAHNNPEDLEKILEKRKEKRKLVLIEGLYSTDGNMAKMPEIVAVCKAYGAGLFVDEAHSSLIFGPNGRGVAEHFGLEDEVGVSFGTLSKAFGGVGGFICSNKDLVSYLKGYSSSYNFSCAIAPPIVGGLIKSLEVATRDSSLRDRLWENTRYMQSGLKSLNLNIGMTESHVIPIIIGSSAQQLIEMTYALNQHGLLLQPVDYPAVPISERRFRLSVSSELTKEDMDFALNVIEEVIARKLGTVGK